MLTLKVITTDINGQKETHLFYGERIHHKEIECAEHNREFNLGEKVILINTDCLSKTPLSNQAYIESHVSLYEDGDTLKQFLLILPCADCYIMHEGKTIDTFSARFK